MQSGPYHSNVGADALVRPAAQIHRAAARQTSTAHES